MEIVSANSHSVPANEFRPVRPRSGNLRVCMIVYNNCAADARVLKEAATLNAAGHHVQIVAVLDKRTTPREERDGISIVRINRDPPHYWLLRTTRRRRRRLHLRRVLVGRRARQRWRRFTRPGPSQALLPRLQRIGTRRAAAKRSRPSRLVGEGFEDGSGRGLGRIYRALRWRVLRAFPPVRGLYYRLRVRSIPRRRLRGYRERAEETRERRAHQLAKLVPAASFLPATLIPTVTAARRLKIAEADAISAERAGETEELPPAPPVVRPTTPKDDAPGRWKRLDSRISGFAYRALMMFHKPLLYLDFYWRAYRLLRAEAFDVVHAHDLNTLPVAAALARRGGPRLVYDAHELYTEVSTLSRLERRVWRVVERLLIPRAEQVFTVCESIAEELVQRYRVAKPTVLLNCPPATPLPITAPSWLREKAGLLDSPEPIVLYQGGFAVHRGLPELLDAVAYLERGIVVLMGWGVLEPELRRLVDELNLEARVRIIGPAVQSELLEYTMGADIGVIPYLPVGLNNYYSTPNKLFEYIAAGVPIVASRVPELERFVEGYGVGYTFDPREPQELGLTLNYLLQQPTTLAAMRSRAVVAREQLHWENQQPALLAAYETGGG
jgi:glycosyltransferase involved in cell wall biosynthesis